MFKVEKDITGVEFESTTSRLGDTDIYIYFVLYNEGITSSVKISTHSLAPARLSPYAHCPPGYAFLLMPANALTSMYEKNVDMIYIF